MVAVEYLKHRAQSDPDTAAALDLLTEQLKTAYLLVGSDSAGKIVLGLQPTHPMNSVDPLSSVMAPNERQEPGLSSYSQNSSSMVEFPQADGALLGYLTATVDEHTDVWGTARSPVEAIYDKVLENLPLGMGEAVTGLKESINHAQDEADSWCRVPVIGWLTCGLIQGVLWLAEAVTGALEAVMLKGPAESASEHAIAGCGPPLYPDRMTYEIIGDLVSGAENDTSLTPTERSELAKAIEDDSDFYNALGLQISSCWETKEELDSIHAFRTFGTPASQGQLMLMIRARIVDFIKHCTKQGVAIGDCVDDESNIRSNMRSLYPWSLSAESVKRLLTTEPQDDHWERWHPANNFTSTSHFVDMLSPVNGDGIWEYGDDGTGPAIDFINDSIQTLAAGPNGNGGRFGRYHAFDGYSLGELGDAFVPVASRQDQLAFPHSGDPATFAHDNQGGYAVQEIGGKLDRAIVDNANLFKLRLAPASDYLVLRRRLCTHLGKATLRTSDGLQKSVCPPEQLETMRERELPQSVMPPADLGALDGFVSWVYGNRPDTLWTDPRNGEQRAAPYYESFLPLLHLWDSNGGAFPSGYFFCSNGQCESDENILADNYWGLAPVREAIRLRGLGVALHMVQDMTVPHHLAPTTAYGHPEYERWFRDYFWPTEDRPLQVAEGIYMCFCENSDLGDCAVDGVCWQGDGSTGGRKRVGREYVGTTDPITGAPVVSFVNVSNFWNFAPPASGDPTEALFQYLTSGDEDPATGEISKLWADVDGAYDELHSLMDELAVGSPCPEAFSTRRLMWATAWATMERAWIATRDLTKDLDSGTVIGGDISDEERIHGGFWLASSALNSPRIVGETHKDAATRGSTLWQELSRETMPYLVAATAIMLENAGKSRDSSSSTCDLPGNDGYEEFVAHQEQPLNTVSCAESRRQTILDCFGLIDVGATTADCDAYGGIERFDACRGRLASSLDGSCGRAATEIAACACSEYAGADIQDVASVDACAAQNMTDDGLDDLYAAHQIDSATYAFVRANQSCGGSMDSDGDCIPNSVDTCPTQGSSGTNWKDTSFPADICWHDAARQGYCRYGCPIALTPEDGE